MPSRKKSYLKKKKYLKSEEVPKEGKSETELNDYESILLKAIQYSTIKRSTRELAKATEMDWSTANKYLNSLKSKGRIKEFKKGSNKTVWGKN